MNQKPQPNSKLKATLRSIEGKWSYLNYADDDAVMRWPTELLPDGIHVDDEVDVYLHFEVTEERKAEIKQKEKTIEAYAERCKLLEELVN